MLDPRHMEGHRPPLQPFTRLGNLLRIRLTPTSTRLTLAEPVSQSQSIRQTRGTSPSTPSTLTILQPRWDHLPTSADQNNATVLNGPWGLNSGIKMNHSLRLGFQNLGCLPAPPSHPNNDQLRSFFLNNVSYIYASSDTNVNCTRLQLSSQFN